MRWYVNDDSVQGQFTNELRFEEALGELNNARSRVEGLRVGLRTSSALADRFVRPGLTVRHAVLRSSSYEFRNVVLAWLHRTGPFIEQDRLNDDDDYFEYAGFEVTNSGLGEAARRVKNGEETMTFSFSGGHQAFDLSPLPVDHGLPEDRLGRYDVNNTCSVDELIRSALAAGPPIATWRDLIETARVRFPHLLIPDSVYENIALAREPFDSVIRDHTLVLFQHLESYMRGRGAGGAEGPEARAVIKNFFEGPQARFSPESATNRSEFRTALTFRDPESTNSIFAHWHGKIRHRFFRLHFEWPVPAGADVLKVLYLGPKITKG